MRGVTYCWVFTAALAGALLSEPARGDQIRKPSAAGTGWTLVGWNDLGMHCMDADYSVFSILPPFNTIHAHLVDASGRLVRAGDGVTVTYEAVADANGSINTTSRNKTNFWQFVQALYGPSPDVDTGLAGSLMPGPSNQPQPMAFDGSLNWFSATGIPLTPYDDAGNKNTYPMMRLTARNASGAVLATTDIVLPVSDEMDCSACHSSGSGPDARPASGWANDADPGRDYRLNILQLHDDAMGDFDKYTAALTKMGYNRAGLIPTVKTDGKPVLCAACHASNALAGTGIDGIPPLTQVVHAFHSGVTDPQNGLTLGESANRSACYRCHPGSVTKCLRGAMGSAVNPDGSAVMQCQSCHGQMAAVGSTSRQGWFEEPACQGCHTGTATSNAGQIRFTSVFDAAGNMRQPANQLFATNADTPAPGLSLYRFSQGHGGLQCEACHGSTHAEFPASHPNDNVQSINLQGHAGVITECTTCHNAPLTASGGPHGLHPIGQTWVSAHQRAGRGSVALAGCQGCHGTDYRGTVLSRSQADRALNAEEFGIRQFKKGVMIGCYSCHNGPNP